MDCFFAIQRSFLSCNRCCQCIYWKPSTPSFSTLLPCTKIPSTLFGSVRLFTPSLVDLERILEAIVVSRTYSKLQNLLGIVPLFPMVTVCVPPPANVTDLVPSEQRILKCSNFRKYLSEQGGISSTLNQGTGTDSYCVTTYTGECPWV